MQIKINEEELFELIEMVSNRMEFDRELIPLYEKLCKHQNPLDKSKWNLDYEIPEYKPKVIKKKYLSKEEVAMKRFKDRKFNLHNYMCDILYEFYEKNELEHLCASDSLAVGNYKNTKHYLFLQRFCSVWDRVEQREFNKEK